MKWFEEFNGLPQINNGTRVCIRIKILGKYVFKGTNGVCSNDYMEDIRPPLQAIKYYQKSNENSDNLNHLFESTSDMNQVFTASLEFTEISHEHASPDNNLNTSKQTEQTSDQRETSNQENNTNELKATFSSYLYIPDVTINHNNAVKISMGPHNQLPTLVYQSSLVVGNCIYVIGGLCTLSSISQNFPRDYLKTKAPYNIDLSEIAIHFPYSLPKVLSRDLLTNPLLSPNKDIFLVNSASISLSVTTKMKGDIPPPLLFLSNIMISKRHAFFYGGLEIITDRIEYDESKKKWILHKKVVMNEDGYILDVRTLRFTRISLKSKIAGKSFPGRIGNSLIGNTFRPKRKHGTSRFSTSNDAAQEAASRTDDISDKMQPSFTPSHRTSKSQDFTPTTTIFNNLPNTSFHMGNMFQTKANEVPFRMAYNHRSNMSNSEVEKDEYDRKCNIAPISPKPSHFRNQDKPQLPTTLLHPFYNRTHGTTTPSPYKSQDSSRESSPLFTKHRSSYSSDSDSYTDFHTFKGSIKSPLSRNDNQSPTFSVNSSRQSTDNDSIFLSGSEANVILFSFGGLKLDVDPTCDNRFIFKETSDLLKIELVIKHNKSKKTGKRIYSFNSEALVTSCYEILYDLVSDKNEKIVWPCARAFFGFSMRDNAVFHSTHSSTRDPDSTQQQSNESTIVTFYDNKCLIIHGGTNSKNDIMGSMYSFNFKTGKWIELVQYAHGVETLSANKSKVDFLHPAQIPLCFHVLFSISDYLLFYGGVSSTELASIPKLDEFNDNKVIIDEHSGFDKTKTFMVNTLHRQRLFQHSEDGTICPNVEGNEFVLLNMNTQTFYFTKFFNNISKYMNVGKMKEPFVPATLSSTIFRVIGASYLFNDSKLTIIGGQLLAFKQKKSESEGNNGEVALVSNRGILVGPTMAYLIPWASSAGVLNRNKSFLQSE